MVKSGKVTNLKVIKNKSKDSSKVSALSPREIVSELDRYVIGQKEAKKAVAVALRNRWRRQALSDEMRDEVLPKNILMIGPTGVGKTEISRRLSRLAEAPSRLSTSISVADTRPTVATPIFAPVALSNPSSCAWRGKPSLS